MNAPTFLPAALNPLTVVFPGDVTDLLPRIPDDFPRDHACLGIASRWFFTGLPNAVLDPVEGVDRKAAVHHLACIQGSFVIDHGLKERSVGYLMSIWFKKITVDGNVLWEAP